VAFTRFVSQGEGKEILKGLEDSPITYDPFPPPPDHIQFTFERGPTPELVKKLKNDGLFVTTKAQALFQSRQALDQYLILFRSGCSPTDVRESLQPFRKLSPSSLFPGHNEYGYLISGVPKDKFLAAAHQVRSKLKLVICEGEAHPMDISLLSAVASPVRVQGLSPVALIGPTHRWSGTAIEEALKFYQIERSKVSHWIQFENGNSGLLAYVKDLDACLALPPKIFSTPGPVLASVSRYLFNATQQQPFATRIEEKRPQDLWEEWLAAGKHDKTPRTNARDAGPRAKTFERKENASPEKMPVPKNIPLDGQFFRRNQEPIGTSTQTSHAPMNPRSLFANDSPLKSWAGVVAR